MKEKVKDIVVSLCFVIVIFTAFILNIVIEDKEISTSERRKLKQFPNISKVLFSGNINDEIENYAMDQFPLRDSFRSMKSYFKLDILKQKNNNNLFVVDDSIYKIEYPLNEKSVENISSKINYIYNKYLQNSNKIFYTIVPDKNYFLDEEQGYLKLDYENLENIMNDRIANQIKYIDIFDTLSINSYYKTDTHWKQDMILSVADKIETEMGIKDRITYDYDTKEYGKFYGVYYGQLGKNLKPDNIKYLTNDIIENAITYNYETQKQSRVYDIEKANESMDKYDLFLSGATPLIEIRNGMSDTDKELIVFRDSFGSSIIPLFTQAYKKIIVIDTRYIATDLLQNYVEFDNKDILFLYSTLVINESSSLK